MISILIPVYNRGVVVLVTALQTQLSTIAQKAEIVIMDDGSTDETSKNANRSLSELNGVRYIELSSNTGRNIIRHELAAAATYNTLIFLDADSNFASTDWLKRYANAAPGTSVIMGGRLYNESSPGASTLHFHYGKLREQHKAAYRNRHPYRSFLACNFLISKQQLSQLIIDDHLYGYCHEDTFMGLQFEKLGIKVKHIDNPVYHEGVDNDEVFIKKQQEALDNLHYLFTCYHNQYDFDNGIKLIRAYKKIKRFKLGKFLLDKMASHAGFLKNKTMQSHNLFWLDCWKLAMYHSLSKKAAQ